MEPDQVIQTLKDSVLRGRGGAGFPTGVKWGFIPQGDGKPHYLVVNADESEPGACKDMPTLLANPQALIEGIVIAAYAIRADRAFIYVRGEVLHVVRRLHHAVAEAREAGFLGENILGSGFDLEVVVHAGRRRLHLRRGDRAAGLAGGKARPAPAEAAVPRDRRACTPAPRWSTTSSRSPPCRTSCSTAPRSSPSLGTREVQGVRDLLAVRPRHHARPVRGAARHHPARAARPGGRHPRRAPAEVLDAGRVVHAAVHRRAPGRAAGLRVGGRRRVDARHPVDPALRRDHLRGPGRAAVDRVLPARVVRQVHALPGGQLLGRAAAGAAGERRGQRGRPGQAAGHLHEHHRPGVLRPGRLDRGPR